jgi:hypothetical protein
MNGIDTLIVLTVTIPLAIILLPRWYFAHTRKVERAKRAPRKPGAPRPGELVRILVAIPERGIECGVTGRVKMVWPGDDREFFVQVEGVDGYVMFTENELWQLELVA